MGREGYSQTWEDNGLNPGQMEEFEKVADNLYSVETERGDAYIHERDGSFTFIGDQGSVNRSLRKYQEQLGKFEGFTNGTEESYSIRIDEGKADDSAIRALEDFGVDLKLTGAERLIADGGEEQELSEDLYDSEHFGMPGQEHFSEEGSPERDQIGNEESYTGTMSDVEHESPLEEVGSIFEK